MEEFGRFLKEERMARGISLSAVQVSTRIRTAYLEAIEAGDFASLPGNTYARGFLKLYAKSIGLDPEEVVKRYDALYNQQAAELQEIQPPTREGISERLARRRRKRRMQTLRLAGILVLLVALIVVGREWLFAPESDLPADGIQVGGLIDDEPVPESNDSPTDTDGNNDFAPVDESSIQIPSDDDETIIAQADQSAQGSANQSGDEADQDASEQQTAQFSDVVGDDSTAGESDEQVPPAWAPADDEIEIHVRLTYEGLSWSGVWVDGERVVYEEVPAGTVLNWTARESIRVRLGRGNDVHIELNGEDLGPAGNGVVDREFTVESVMALRRQED